MRTLHPAKVHPLDHEARPLTAHNPRSPSRRGGPQTATHPSFERQALAVSLRSDPDAIIVIEPMITLTTVVSNPLRDKANTSTRFAPNLPSAPLDSPRGSSDPNTRCITQSGATAEAAQPGSHAFQGRRRPAHASTRCDSLWCSRSSRRDHPSTRRPLPSPSPPGHPPLPPTHPPRTLTSPSASPRARTALAQCRDYVRRAANAICACNE